MKTKLNRSIISLMCALSAFEMLGFALLAYANKFSVDIFYLFLAVQVGFHTLVCIALILLSPYFYILATGMKLETVNLANRITIFRISMLPTILVLIIAHKEYDIGPLLFICVGLTFITDMLDGRISRKKNQITFIGKILDSSSDYALIIVVSFAYYFYGFLPAWIFGLILFRIFFQALGMALVLAIKKSLEPSPTILGKIAIATIMTLYAAISLDIYFPLPYPWILDSLYGISGIIMIASIIDKAWHFIRSGFREKPA